MTMTVPAAPGLRPGLALMAALLASGCAGNGQYGSSGPVPYDGYDPAAARHARAYAPRRYYPPPGPASDQWGPYIREAANRFRVPEQWVRAVMHQESGGREQAVSPVGAMGLMQVMPATYAGLRSRHGLGTDAYDPHNNILAGTAYIREMYDRYGSPGFLAAYNAGPDRLDRYLAGTSALPDETVNYLASITPNLGNAVPLSGSLATYASRGVPTPAPSVASLAAGCDENAAYDPDRPCAPLLRAASAPVQLASVTTPAGCDADAAFDSPRACAAGSAQPSLASIGSAIYRSAAPAPRALPVTGASMPAYGGGNGGGGNGGGGNGGWGIQVGAFANVGLARAVAEGARAEAPDQLRGAVVALPTTSPFGGSVLYRARLVNLSAGAASSACQHLNQRQLPCVVVQPTGA